VATGTAAATCVAVAWTGADDFLVTCVVRVVVVRVTWVAGAAVVSEALVSAGTLVSVETESLAAGAGVLSVVVVVDVVVLPPTSWAAATAGESARAAAIAVVALVRA